MRTVALKPTRKPIQGTPVGSVIHVPPHIAKVLLHLGLVEEAPAEKPKRVYRRRDETADKPKRAYRRRDMQAEE